MRPESALSVRAVLRRGAGPGLHPEKSGPGPLPGPDRGAVQNAQNPAQSAKRGVAADGPAGDGPDVQFHETSGFQRGAGPDILAGAGGVRGEGQGQP